MARRKRINRKGSTDDEKAVSTFVGALHRYRKQMEGQLTVPLWRRMLGYFVICLSVRLSSASVITTEFVPDEAWQSTEVAYYYVYGRGHLTWEWIVGLRNHIYPFSIAAIFRLLKLLGCDSSYNIILLPRMFQATITAIGDYAFFLYCIKRFGHRAASWCLIVSLTCWFTYYCGARTITNTTEMALNSIAMYLMIENQACAMVGVVALNFLIRPTAIVIWIPQFYDVLCLFFPLKDHIRKRIPAAIMVGLLVITTGSMLDSLVYGRPVMAWLRFLKFNFVDGQSAQFGEHHILWYFYSGIPSILLLNVLVLLVSLWLRTNSKDWQIILGFIFVMSLVRHKEIRFLLPVMPYVFAVIGDVLYKCNELVKQKEESVLKQEKVNIRRIFVNALLLGLAANFLAGAYFCSFHQGGIIRSTEYMNNASKSIENPNIWVMMQCYSVPVFTYMHNPKAHFEYITCGPSDLGLETSMLNFRRYTTNETQLGDFISERLDANNGTFPDFVMCFDEISSYLEEIFKTLGQQYFICNFVPHAQFGEDKGMVNVLCKKPNEKTFVE